MCSVTVVRGGVLGCQKTGFIGGGIRLAAELLFN
jgi:hypothetical protein